MIFNNRSSIYSMDGITESPYNLGLEGALMHVYENECNYNAIMKSVGVSELRYYQETGRDLFVHEAGAFSGFIDKIKLFFKKVIEKIKSIFAKFVAKINQFTMDDKKFVKKYRNDIMRKDTTDFEFDNGYKFDGLEAYCKHISDTSEIENHKNELDKIKTYNVAQADQSQPEKMFAPGTGNYRHARSTGTFYGAFKTEDEKSDFIEEQYAKIANKDGKSFTLEEMREEIKDTIYGEDGKTTLEKIEKGKWLGYIENTSKDIRDVEKAKNKIVKSLENISDEFAKLPGKISKEHPAKDLKDDSKELKNTNAAIKAAGQWAEIFKCLANAYTEAFGMVSGAYKDRNRQARAMCIKILSYKHESVDYRNYGSYDSSDIFADVVIR